MKAIKTIISLLSEEEKREFLLFLQKKNRRGDTKNIKLFKLINAGKTKDLDLLLYGKPSKNAFHGLCKRLQDSLIDFVATRSFAGETSEELEILKLLLASRIFFEHRRYPLAFKTLTRAERMAQSLDVYSILTEIYHTKIQYAHLNPKFDLQKIIDEAQANIRLFQQEQQLNMAYASIKASLKKKHYTAINELIVKAFSDFNIELSKTLTYKSLFQLMNLTATAARLQSDYYEISPFMSQLYHIISEKQADEINPHKHLFYHIEILNLMGIMEFRNKNFKRSMHFTNLMELQMVKNKKAYFNRFSEKLTVLKAHNFQYTGQPKQALKTLDTFQHESLDLDLTRVMILFQQNQFTEAYQIIKNNYHSDNWLEKKAGWIWVLKKNIIEILLLMELDRLDLVLSRLKSFQNKFTKRLKAIDELRVLEFMRLVSHYYQYPEQVTSAAFKARVEESFDWLGPEREDIFVMSFYAWLKSKMEQTPLYETTLTLVNMHKNTAQTPME